MRSIESGDSWFHVLLTEPRVLGALTWLSLSITVAGFWIALAQIRKVQNASEAANASVRDLIAVVRSQERSAKIAEALTQVRSAQERIKQASLEAAAAI